MNHLCDTWESPVPRVVTMWSKIGGSCGPGRFLGDRYDLIA
jgi:hypothetical protein